MLGEVQVLLADTGRDLYFEYFLLEGLKEPFKVLSVLCFGGLYQVDAFVFSKGL